MDTTDEFVTLRRSRNRRLLMGGAGLLITVTLVLGVLRWTAPQLPPLPEDAAKVAQALPSLRREVLDLASLGGQALAELEGDRLPSDLNRAFASIAQVSPAQLGLVCAASIAEGDGAPLFIAACPGGPAAFRSWATSKDPSAIAAACKDALEGLMSQEEAKAGTPSCVALAATTWAFLKSKRAEQPVERELLRMVALGK